MTNNNTSECIDSYSAMSFVRSVYGRFIKQSDKHSISMSTDVGDEFVFSFYVDVYFYTHYHARTVSFDNTRGVKYGLSCSLYNFAIHLFLTYVFVRIFAQQCTPDDHTNWTNLNEFDCELSTIACSIHNGFLSCR